MTEEMNELLTRLDELITEAHEKGYSFVFNTIDQENLCNSIVMFSGNPTFNIDIIEWNYVNED